MTKKLDGPGASWSSRRTPSQPSTGPNVDYERMWIDLAKSTQNPDEAMAALDHALELNPDNLEARNLRVAIQVGSLRKSVEPTLSSYREGSQVQWHWPAAIALALVLLAVLIFVFKDSLQGLFVSTEQAPTLAATLAIQALPATWTPEPTATMTPVPVLVVKPSNGGVQARMEGDIPARSGPGLRYPIVGLFKGTVIVPLLGRSEDGSFLQVQPANYDKPVWVQASAARLLTGSVSTLPVIRLPTPSTP